MHLKGRLFQWDLKMINFAIKYNKVYTTFEAFLGMNWVWVNGVKW